MLVPDVPFIQGRNAYPDRDSQKYGIAIHCTANTASDTNEAKYATERTDDVSSHFYVDNDSVTQSLDTDDRAGHAGSYFGNEHAIAFELSGLTTWTREQWIDNICWPKFCDVLRIICKEYEIQYRRASVAEMKQNPEVRAFYGHNDMRLAWGGTTHTDPGENFPWDYLFSQLNKKKEPEMFMVKSKQDSLVLLSNGIECRRVPDTATRDELQKTGVPYVVVSTNAMRDKMAGPRADIEEVSESPK